VELVRELDDGSCAFDRHLLALFAELEPEVGFGERAHRDLDAAVRGLEARGHRGEPVDAYRQVRKAVAAGGIGRDHAREARAFAKRGDGCSTQAAAGGVGYGSGDLTADLLRPDRRGHGDCDAETRGAQVENAPCFHHVNPPGLVALLDVLLSPTSATVK